MPLTVCFCPYDPPQSSPYSFYSQILAFGWTVYFPILWFFVCFLLYGQIPGWVWECFWSIFRPSCEGKVCNWLLIIAKRIDLMNMLHWQQKYKAGFMSCELAGLLNTFLGCLALCHHAWQVAADLCLSFVISSPSYSINDDGKKAICGRLQWELIRADMLPTFLTVIPFFWQGRHHTSVMTSWMTVCLPFRWPFI